MAVSSKRLSADIDAIARFTQTPGAGATRPTFSAEWGKARDYVADEARRAGCDIRTDAAGNLHARPKSLGWEQPAWLCGSHLDSVPHGGNYDGVAGVVAALEILRSAAEDSIAAPLELIVFAEEEGTTFGLGMLGSRAWVGDLTRQDLENLRNAAGQNFFKAGKPFGVDAERLEEDRFQRARYLGLIEIHIEQGPGLWRRRQSVAIVRAIAARKQHRAIIGGEANHAGATRMNDRRDALAGAAEIILYIESLAKQRGGDVVATVGRLVNSPNAINVISNRVEFTIDLRAPDDDAIAAMDAALRKDITEICRRRNLKFELETTEAIAARPMDATLCDRLARVIEIASATAPPETTSGALHDSAVLAPHLPTTMLFVPSLDGVSHHPSEYSRVEEIAAAASAVERLVRKPTLAQLNKMDRRQFVTVCGGLFEHSPWIAERAWDSRPFTSLGDLHEKLAAATAHASEQEHLALICAHPDLVGRLAREGKVTAESTAEQKSAGLSALSPDEIALFERYNEQYRQKFGFPFVICARQNKKEAILRAFPRRLANSREAELATALCEIYKIAQLRLGDAVWES
jgi:OHCU decarboxylase